MDEAFSALDVLTAENLRIEVVKLWLDRSSAGLKSIFFVTHNIEEAVFMASRILIMSSHPGRITHEIVNPLPYPRDPKSGGFAAMMEQIHAAITALVLPDKPEEQAAPAAAREGEPVAQRIEPIPNVPVATIVGLLEILEASKEEINVFDLGQRIGKDFGETIAIVKAAEMLDLVETPKDDVRMMPTGWYFLAAPLPQRKALFRHAIMKLRLFQMLAARLAEAPAGRIPADDVQEMLATLLPYDQPDKLFETLVAWGRYAEILDYDQDAGAVHLLEPEAESEAPAEAKP
jgi:NitT/TauT family transport system ATP-binding protein